MQLSNGLTVTATHYFLNERGEFERIDDLIARGGKIVREDGSLESVTAERIVYSEATRHLYEEAEEVVYATSGGVALQPEIRRGWRTYNFEVEHYHTYIAGGVRVHNDSLQNYLSLSTMLHNDSYVAVAFENLKNEFGDAGVAAAAYRGEPFTSAGYGTHLCEIEAAHKEALRQGDYKMADALLEGLENVIDTGLTPAERLSRQARDENLDSDALPELDRQLGVVSDNKKNAVETRDRMRDARDAALSDPSSAPDTDDDGDVPDARTDPDAYGSNKVHSQTAPTEKDDRPAKPVVTTVGPATVTQYADGTLVSETNGHGRRTFSVVKGKDLLELGEKTLLTDGTVREVIRTAMAKGGVQETVTIYDKDGDVLSQKLNIRGVKRLEFRRNDDGTKGLSQYAADGLLTQEVFVNKNGSGWVWTYDSNTKKRKWMWKKSYFDKKGRTTYDQLTLSPNTTKDKSYTKNHTLAAFVTG